MAWKIRYTARDMVLAQREAFKDGVRSTRCAIISDGDVELRYPIPKVTRRRVEADPYAGATPKVWWTVVDGAIRVVRGRRNADAEPFIQWSAQLDAAPLPDRVRLWADLLANPDEEVEGDEDYEGGN